MQNASFSELAEYRWQSAGVEEILHKMFAGRLDIDEAGQGRAQAIKITKFKRNASAPRDCHQVNHCVCRASNGSVGENGIFEGFTGEYSRDTEVVFHHLHDPPAGQLRLGIAARTERG